MDWEMNDIQCPKGSETSHITFVDALLCVITWALFAAFVYKLDYNAKPKANKILKDGKNIKLIGLSAMTTYLICINTIFFSSLFQTANGFECQNNLVVEMAFVLDFLGFGTVLALFSYRLIKTFENSIYALTITQKKLIKISLIGIFLILITLCILAIFVRDKNGAILMSLAVLYMICVFINCMVLLKLFIGKLNEMINSFINQFGTVSASKLAELNKSVRYTVYIIHIYL